MVRVALKSARFGQSGMSHIYSVIFVDSRSDGSTHSLICYPQEASGNLLNAQLVFLALCPVDFARELIEQGSTGVNV